MELDALKKIEEKLRVRYLRSVADLQLKYHRRRHSSEYGTRLLMWIRSTSQKDSFAWSMVRARCVREPYSQSEIMDATSLSRQSISEMVKTCVAEEWIDVYCDGKKIDKSHVSDCNGKLSYMASNEMFEEGLAYIERHITTTEATYMNKNWDDLMSVRKVMDVIQ